MPIKSSNRQKAAKIQDAYHAHWVSFHLCKNYESTEATAKLRGTRSSIQYMINESAKTF
jgi:hypothetical protein